MDELKERILRGVRADRYAFVVSGAEVRECFTIESLGQWAADNALTYTHSPSIDEYYFAVSPALSAIKAARRGTEAMVIKINDQATTESLPPLDVKSEGKQAESTGTGDFFRD